MWDEYPSCNTPRCKLLLGLQKKMSLRGAKRKETPNLKKRYFPVEETALNSHFCKVLTTVNGVRHL